MKGISGLAFVALVAACTPAATSGTSGPEATVQAIYQPLVDSKGEKTTSLAQMPLSEELKALVDKAEAAAKDEPVFDGDIAGDCQDCAGFSSLKVAGKADAGLAAGHKAVEATFKLYADVPRSVVWDMVETPQGWRVDNVVSSDGIDVRKIAQEAIDAAANAPDPATDEAVQCMAYLRVSSNGAKKAKPPGDTKVLDAAYDAFQRRAEAAFTADELAKALASDVNGFEDILANQLKAKTDACLAKTPQ